METENSNNKSSLWKWIGLLVLVVLVAAAFVGGQLLNRRSNPQVAGPGAMFNVKGEGGAAAGEEIQSFEVNVIPAEELPEAQPDAVGIFVRREDNSIFIGTGKLTMGMTSESGASPSASYDGPVVEVVVNTQTVVYKEVTALSGPPTGEEIQQEVVEGTIEDLGDTSTIVVWGRKVGDRIIADVLLYSEPVIMMAPKP
jgi:hypothetical protein